MSRIEVLQWQQIHRMGNAAVETIRDGWKDYRRYSDRHHQRWGEFQSNLALGFGAGSVVALVGLTADHGVIVHGIVWKIGVSLGMVMSRRLAFITGTAFVSIPVALFGQTTLPLLFLVSLIGSLPALMITAIVAARVTRQARRLARKSLELEFVRLLSVGPPDEFYKRLKSRQGQAKWRLWAFSTPKHHEFYADDLSRAKRISRKAAIAIARDMKGQGQHKIYNRRSS